MKKQVNIKSLQFLKDGTIAVIQDTQTVYETDKTFEVLDIIDVPVITLNDFFDFFPWDKVEYIDQVKIDAQSSDFNIIKGMDRYMQDKVVFIDVETHTNGQYYSEEYPIDLKNYMIERNFECINWGINSTFLNTKLKNKLNKINYHILDM